MKTLPRARTWAKASRVYDALQTIGCVMPRGVAPWEVVGVIADTIQAEEDSRER